MVISPLLFSPLPPNVSPPQPKYKLTDNVTLRLTKKEKRKKEKKKKKKFFICPVCMLHKMKNNLEKFIYRNKFVHHHQSPLQTPPLLPLPVLPPLTLTLTLTLTRTNTN